MQTRMSFGEGASPALAGDTLVVNWDHEGESFIVALDARTGAERWRAARNEIYLRGRRHLYAIAEEAPTAKR